MYYGNGYFESSGSMFDDRRELQSILYDSRVPLYVKEELISQHNNHFLDSMTTDTVTNMLRYDIDTYY